MSVTKMWTAAAVVLVLLLAVGLAVRIDGSRVEARAQDKGTWQDLVLLYTSDIKGKIEPCG